MSSWSNHPSPAVFGARFGRYRQRTQRGNGEFAHALTGGLRAQHHDRPLDVTIDLDRDGGLYVADYSAGLIYQIVYGAP